MKKINDIKISVKLIVGGLIAVLIPMLIVGALSVNTASKALVDAALQTASRASQDLAMTTTIFLEEEMKFAQEMALTPVVDNAAKQVAENGIDGAMAALQDMDSFLKKAHD
ncbi:MAG: methyl-accepting chemotaxis protein, partial [Desulfobacterales bacterium]|nr:methyl-accepting chemotaxis protein [Desulfobacterales bacterium]